VLVEQHVVRLGGGAELVDTGVVDQDVHVACLCSQPARVVGARQISRHETRLATGVVYLLHCFGAALRAAPVYDHVCAEGCELHRDRAADTSGRPGYQRGRAF
jgi:hypothetical protein